MFKNLVYKNPNKYLIRKKKFIRDFSSLYKNIKDPWNQNKNFKNEETIIFSLDIIDRLAKKKKTKISLLDIGAGSGSLKKILNNKIKYVGTDIHKRKFKHIIYDNIEIHNPKFVNKFDIIVCFKTIYYLGDKIKIVIQNMKKYLRKNGYLFISYNLKKKSFSNRYLTDLKLRKILKKHFFEIYTVEINREISEMNNEIEKNTLFVFKK